MVLTSGNIYVIHSNTGEYGHWWQITGYLYISAKSTTTILTCFTGSQCTVKRPVVIHSVMAVVLKRMHQDMWVWWTLSFQHNAVCVCARTHAHVCACGGLMTVHPMPVSATWSICKSLCMTGKEGYSGKGYTQFPSIPDYRIFMLVSIYWPLLRGQVTLSVCLWSSE
jgi:hypothetical protein